MDLPTENGDFHSYVSLPEGNSARRIPSPNITPHCMLPNTCKSLIKRMFFNNEFIRIIIHCIPIISPLYHHVCWFSHHFSCLNHNYRRKFRSQTSDNMERWKAEQGRGREKRKIRREKIRRERVRRQKIQMREKVGKSRNTVFFQWFVAPEGRKVGSLKRRVRSQLATGAMKNCTPLWREAHFEVKSVKNWRSRTTFGSWDVEKVHFEVKMYKTLGVRTTFGSRDVEKVHAVVARSTFWSQKC